MQQGLLSVYDLVRRTGVLETRGGRRAFELAYGVYKRLWEPGVGDLSHLVLPGTWVIDVGANVGFFSIQFARWVSLGGRVLAIEPEARNLESLRRALGAAGVTTSVEVVEAVAAETEGEFPLVLNPLNPADHRIGAGGVPTRAVTLDALLGRYGDPVVSLIKIDVQGAEMRVLAGAQSLLDKHRPALMVEIDDAALAGFGTSAVTLMRHLESLGYGMYALDDVRRQRPLSHADVLQRCETLGYADFLFIATR